MPIFSCEGLQVRFHCVWSAGVVDQRVSYLPAWGLLVSQERLLRGPDLEPWEAILQWQADGVDALALGGDGACPIQLCSDNNVGGIGIVDTLRTGEDIEPCVRDTRWKEGICDVATTGINRCWQNKRFFIADPDNLGVAEYKNYHLYRDCVDFGYKWALSFDEARVRTTLVAAVGGNIALGDRLILLEPKRITILKKLLPLHGQSAIPLDMFEQTIPSLWWHHVSKPWGSWEVLSVVNFGESSLAKEISLSPDFLFENAVETL